MFSFINTDILVNLVLALITFSLGLTLTRQNFTNLWLNPKAIGVGLFSQIVILPLIAIVILSYFNIDPVLKVGFIVIAICPGGSTSNLLSFMMKGNVALSLSLTVINSVITLFTIPFLTNLALDYYVGQNIRFRLPFWSTFGSIFLVTILPAMFGVLMRARFKEAAKKIQPILHYVLPAMLFLVFALKIFGSEESGGVKLSRESYVEMLPIALSLNIISMALGFLIGTILLVRFKNRLTILIEIGVQNTAMALLVTGVLMEQSEMEKPALVYATFTFFSTLLVAWIFKTLFLFWKKTLKNSKNE
jgi:BASS family bile acid:Na+ symporter